MRINNKDLIGQLKIYGIGFDPINKSCYKKYLLEKLKEEINLKIVNDIPESAEVAIINIDRQTISAILEKSIPNDNCFTILIVHEVSRSIIPFLKLANHVIFINEIQEFICNEYLNISHPSTVLPYFYKKTEKEETRKNDFFIYFEGENLRSEVSYYLELIEFLMHEKKDLDIEHFHLFYEVDSAQIEKFSEFQQQLAAKDSRIKTYNSKNLDIDELFLIMTQCNYGQLFKNETTLIQYLNLVEEGSPSVMHETLAESPILNLMQHSGMRIVTGATKSFYNFNYLKRSDLKDWTSGIQTLINENYNSYLSEKSRVEKNVTIDQLQDLNIVWGKPLTNNFVFSICFRNQENKIIRCLESIVNQKENNFGIVLISDCSGDRSVQTILDYIQNLKIDICLVDNEDRKYASRNFYNVIHSLVQNDESVIIEVDGDDFLAGDHVLSTLNNYYKAGAIKTNGSYEMYPADQTFTTKAQIEFNHQNYDTSRPWSIYCTSWLHLRTAKRHLLKKIELKYFLERKSKKWLMDRHDSAIQPRIIELAGNKAVFVKEILYYYDVSGENHDHSTESQDQIILEDYKKMDKMYYPLSLTYTE